MPRYPAPDAPGRLGRRRFIGAALALAGWAGGCSDRGPLRVGFIGGMSGRVADLGIGGRNGTQLGVDDLNLGGGFNGRPVELLTRDDEQDNEKALQRLGELFDAGVAFVVGPMTSSVAVALAPLAAERGIPLISPTSTTHELSGRSDAFFRVVPDAPTGAAQQADALLAQGHRRLVTVADLNNRAFAASWAQGAAARFKAQANTQVLGVEFQSAPGVSYVDIAAQIVAAGADAVVIAASASDTAVLGQQIRRQDARLALAASPWAGTEQFAQMGGRTLDGTQVAQYFDRESTAPAYLQFVKRYMRRFGERPGYPAVNGYDALMLGIEGLRRRGNATLVASLQQLRSHDGLQRRFELDGSGDSRAPMFLTELLDGQYVALKPR